MNPPQQRNGSQPHSFLPLNVQVIRPQTFLKGHSDVRYFLSAVIVAAIYYGAAKLGLSFGFIHANVSPLWPSTGVAIAAVLLLGYRIWPAILLGAFLANLFTPISVFTAGAIAVGNTLEALSAGVMLRSLNFHNSLDRAKDVLKFVVVATLCTMLSATIGNLSLCLSHAAPWREFGNLWLTWWLGDTIGALVLAPLLLTWGTAGRHWLPTKRYLEASVVVLLLAAAAVATFGGPSPVPLRYYPIVRLTIPFFLWAAFRLGQRGVTLATMTMSVFAVWGTAHGLGPFVGRTPNESLLLLQLFLGSNSVTFLFLVAAVEERKLAALTLGENQRRLAGNLAVTQIIAESPSLPDAAPRILQTIGETFGWQAGDMWIVEPEANVLNRLTSWRAWKADFDNFETTSRAQQFGWGPGLPDTVWASSKPIWIPDVELDPTFLRAQLSAGEGIHAALAFPILAAEKVLGVMEFFSHEVREPDNALLQMFSGIGSQIGQFMERKQAEEEREQLLTREHAARAEAELANRTKDEFLAIVSHELRTPLTAIVGWAGALRACRLDKDMASHAIEIIDRNAKLQVQLIEDLLDVARIISGKLRLVTTEVRLQNVIQAVVDSMRPTADEKQIRLQVLLDQNARPVLGDPARLEQIIWNLLSNAVKFTPPAGDIEVRLATADSHAQIVVSDTGQGIDSEFLPYVFDRFRQANDSATRTHSGLGLGLAIVRHLVELHSGTVEASSDGKGKGATFVVLLPFKDL